MVRGMMSSPESAPSRSFKVRRVLALLVGLLLVGVSTWLAIVAIDDLIHTDDFLDGLVATFSGLSLLLTVPPIVLLWLWNRVPERTWMWNLAMVIFTATLIGFLVIFGEVFYAVLSGYAALIGYVVLLGQR